jgi:hypothetical protein
MSDEFDPYAPSSEERYAAMAQVRASGGTVETPAGHYIATAAGVSSGLHDVTKFVGSFIDTSALAEDDVMISAIPEPRHGRIRRVINTVVAAHRTKQNEPFIRERARELVVHAVDRARVGTVDLVDVFDPLPSIVIAHMLGVPAGYEDRFRVWSDELLEAQNAGGTGALSDAHPEFARFVQGSIDDHRDGGSTRRRDLPLHRHRRRRRVPLRPGHPHADDVPHRRRERDHSEPHRNCLYVLATGPTFRAGIAPSAIASPVRRRVAAPRRRCKCLAAVLDETEIEGARCTWVTAWCSGSRRRTATKPRYDDPTEFRLDRRGCATTLRSAPARTVCPCVTRPARSRRRDRSSASE